MSGESYPNVTAVNFSGSQRGEAYVYSGETSSRLGMGGGGGGMDGWQTSVEKRLDSLDRRATSIESGVSEIKTDLATVKTNVEHLPSKGFIVGAVVTSLTTISIVVAIIVNLSGLFK